MIFKGTPPDYHNVVIGGCPHKTEIAGGRNVGRTRLKHGLYLTDESLEINKTNIFSIP